MNKKNVVYLLTAIALSISIGNAQATTVGCTYHLTPAPNQSGAARVTIRGRVVFIRIWRANPKSLYTIWTDHKNRATGELATDYPIDKGALPRGVAPTFASTAGVTSGMGLDPNSIVTNHWGNGGLRIILDHKLLRPGNSPVVGADLVMQGLNRIGGGWLRVYENPHIEEAASLQRTNLRTGLPLLERSTAQGITIVAHPDKVSHGHTPGVGGVDHFPAFSGDFPHWCRYTKDVVN